MRNESDIAALQEQARVNFAIMERADAYISMIGSPGWKYFYEIQTAWLEAKRLKARRADTSKTSEALAILQDWQNAEDLIETQAKHINSIIDHANQIRGNRTLEEALMIERVQHEHSESGNREDSAGY